MDYFWIHWIHLTAAAFFVGGVFFEVLIVSPAVRTLNNETRRQVAGAVGARARRIMPFVVLTLYAAGVGLAWYHRGALTNPASSNFSLLLSLKILLAVSILLHFIAAVLLTRSPQVKPLWSRLIHYSVFVQMIAVVFLAKAMYYPW